MRYLIKFSYDGTNFSGYQKQPGKRCVESELEKALFSINNHKETKVTGAGRTLTLILHFTNLSVH